MVPQSSSSPPETDDSLAGWLLLGGLVSARWLMPVESAPAGETLPLVQVTLLYAVFALWQWAREGRSWRRPKWGDWLVWGLVVAHVGSGLAVLATSGQKRVALNLLWEWIGTGVLWALIGQQIHRLRLLDRLFGGLAIMTIVLAGLGIWQNVVVYPELRGVLDDFDRLEARSDSLSTAETARFRELRSSLPVSYVQGDAASRKMFSQRVRGSQEPMGMFALANSFGGLLLVGGWLAAGRLAEGIRLRRHRAGLVLWGLGLLLIAVCLLWTKARTAWIGGLVGVAVWLALSIDRRSVRNLLMPAALAAGALVLLVGIGLATGRLDAATVAEAPKSIRYRFEYWQSTLAMLRDRPLLGPGLGNFRPRYLQYKLPQSSEEILDPHNFLLDIWANAGLPGFLILLVFLGLMARSLRGEAVSEETPPTDGSPLSAGEPPWWTSLGMGQAGILLAGMAVFLSGSDPVSGLGWIIPVWWIAGALLEKSTGSAIPLPIYAAAWCSFTVHLLGAGGIETPGLTQLWLLLAARVLWSAAPSREASVASSPAVGWTLTALGGAGALACLLTATTPVLSAQAALRIGQEQQQSGQNLAAAIKRYDEASRADSLDPEPWVQKSFVSEIRWQRGVDMHHFDEALQQIAEARRRNPVDPYLVRMTGLLWLVRYDRTHAPEDARKAVDELLEAVRRYPYHAGILADLARAWAPLDAAEARRAAEKSIAQDDLNRRYGHYDKMLTDPVRQKMEELAAPATVSPAAEPSETR